MKTAQHTPGPWFTRGDTLDNTRAIEIEAELPSVGWTTLALVNDRALNCAHLPDGPNARLIAAAPDLLHALKWAAEYVSLYTGNGAGWTGVQQGHDRERFIDDATGDLDAEGLRAFLSETINKAEEG